MQLISNWPADITLALPKTIKQSLIAHLTIPFGNETSAKSFWLEYPPTLVIIDETDSTTTLHNLSEQTLQQIEFAASNPEYSDELGSGYTVKLSITSDDGTGIYVVIHPKNQLFTRKVASNI